jgi:hypothetical protein
MAIGAAPVAPAFVHAQSAPERPERSERSENSPFVIPR